MRRDQQHFISLPFIEFMIYALESREPKNGSAGIVRAGTLGNMMVFARRFMRRRSHAITRLLVFGSIVLPLMPAAETGNSGLERRFSETVRPFLARYCIGCHGGSSPAAQFDLRQYSTIAAVVQDYPRWNLALEKLTAKEMPPKEAKQPGKEARQDVIDWVQA